jgi:YVTN family beta-propeller protein
MSARKSVARGVVLAALVFSPTVIAMWAGASRALAHDAERHKASAIASSPIAITSDDRFVWSVNPDKGSISVFSVASQSGNGTNVKIAEIPVGREPWCVAITPDNRKVYVTNMADGTVSVIDARRQYVEDTIVVGTEPFGCAVAPDGRKLYVANQGSDTVSVISTSHDLVAKTIHNVGPKPHGIAISADGERVFVSQFLAQPRFDDPRPATQTEGADDGREGHVTIIDGDKDRIVKIAVLNPLPDVGAFKSDGSTLGREPLTGVFDNVTGGFPNLLEAIVVRGNVAYVPNTCSSPNGPFRFNVNVQSCLSTIAVEQGREAFPTLNMNVGVNFEPAGKKLFNTNPIAVAFKHANAEGFVALAATDRLLRITLDAEGRPSINPPANAADPGNIVRIELKDPLDLGAADPDDTIGGKNPRGVVINSTDTRAYVMDFVSRDVAVVDISGNNPSLYRTIALIPSSALPVAGTTDAVVLRGKHLFNTAIGPEGALANSKRPAGRMSDTGWGSCYSCHPNGLTDSVTWMFPDGPRQSISLESTFEFGAATLERGAPKLPASHQRALNWSAVRDEVQDFERNIRAVSGGGGLILNVPEGPAGLAQIPDLVGTANTDRNSELDAVASYVALGIRAPIAPVSSHALTTQIGRLVFSIAGCQNCHGGRNWTISALDNTPPAAAADVVDAQLVRFLCRVGTFDPALFADGVSNEIRANNAANTAARGILGFNVPSLISASAGAPYLHSGSARDLDAVLENVTHRSAGRADGIDVLGLPIARKVLVEFLRSIDRQTKPFLNVQPPANACGAP